MIKESNRKSAVGVYLTGSGRKFVQTVHLAEFTATQIFMQAINCNSMDYVFYDLECTGKGERS